MVHLNHQVSPTGLSGVSSGWLQRVVSAITQRFPLTVLAATEKDLFRFFSLVLYRCKRCGFVGAITEGLFAAESALAPEVTFTGLNVDAVRFFLANRRRIAHFMFQWCWYVSLQDIKSVIKRGLIGWNQDNDVWGMKECVPYKIRSPWSPGPTLRLPEWD